jgi:hypothetical protein
MGSFRRVIIQPVSATPSRLTFSRSFSAHGRQHSPNTCACNKSVSAPIYARATCLRHRRRTAKVAYLLASSGRSSEPFRPSQTKVGARSLPCSISATASGHIRYAQLGDRGHQRPGLQPTPTTPSQRVDGKWIHILAVIKLLLKDARENGISLSEGDIFVKFSADGTYNMISKRRSVERYVYVLYVHARAFTDAGAVHIAKSIRCALNIADKHLVDYNTLWCKMKALKPTLVGSLRPFIRCKVYALIVSTSNAGTATCEGRSSAQRRTSSCGMPGRRRRWREEGATMSIPLGA